MIAKNRLRELDFLRGIAILLVLFRHQYLFGFTERMGWIGVDLFFVLSGFLVSGLLFKEFQRYGSIKPKLFLIRRGFKIYPIYFLFYGLYLLPILIKRQFNLTGFLSDMFFVQNYVWGWGYAYAPSWSLAVEEHFYFGFALLVLFGIRYRFFRFEKHETNSDISRFEILIAVVMGICLVLRIISNTAFPNEIARNITMTHLRIDSLLAGVMVSYWYHFRREMLMGFVNANKKMLLLFALALVSFAPFMDINSSFFVKTTGFTFLYIGFGILLAWFLADEKINARLTKTFSDPVVNLVSKIGFASYSIYIIHTFVNNAFATAVAILLKQQLNPAISFVVTSAISIACGLLMTQYIEKYFLSLRDKYYPARVN
ncbi:MAG TPA: acyltransferase [Flavobacterium sp.]|nr:acyltransferase [Flavobacterium sp.]